MTTDLDQPTEHVNLDMLEKAWQGHNSMPVIFKLIAELRQARTRVAALEQAGAMEEMDRLKRIEVAARDIANTLNGGFIVCRYCGEQETTTDIDFAKELYAALAPIAPGGESITAERKRLIDALKSCWDCRTDVSALERVILDAVATLDEITPQDIAWAQERLLARTAFQPPAGDA